MATKNEKARVWLAVGYLENMRDDWQDVIGDVLDGLPCAYCIHDLDKDSKSEHRKDHAHFMIAFSNTTTYNHALKAFRRLDKSEDKTAFNTVKPCLNARGAYDYLIHDTETARKQGKHLYDKSERVEVNNFDIGDYEQLTKESKFELYHEMCDFIIDNEIKTIDVFFTLYDPMRDVQRAEVYMTYMTQLDRMTTAVWKRCRSEQEDGWSYDGSDSSDGAENGAVTDGGATTTPPSVTEDGRQNFEEVQVDEVTSFEDETTSSDAEGRPETARKGSFVSLSQVQDMMGRPLTFEEGRELYLSGIRELYGPAGSGDRDSSAKDSSGDSRTTEDGDGSLGVPDTSEDASSDSQG